MATKAAAAKTLIRPPNETVGIIGAGSWGTTLAIHLAGGGHGTVVWDVDPTVVREIRTKHTNERAVPGAKLDRSTAATSELREVAERSQLLVIALPSVAFREVLAKLGAHVRPDHFVIHTSKGLEKTTAARMTEVIRDETCCKRFGMLTGPNLAHEVLAQEPSAAVIASRYPEVIEAAQRFFVRPFFRVYGSDDVVGIEMGAAIKNVLAIGMGFVSAMGLGQNTRSLIVTRGLAEMIRIGVRLGADARTFNGIAGIGDLIGSGMSRESVNFAVGEMLGKGVSVKEAVKKAGRFPEGIPTSAALHQLIKQLKVDAPLTEAVHQVVNEGAKPARVLQELMTRRPTMELDAHPLA